MDIYKYSVGSFIGHPLDGPGVYIYIYMYIYFIYYNLYRQVSIHHIYIRDVGVKHDHGR